MHPPKTWVVAADDFQAHIFERKDGHLKPVSDLQPAHDAKIEMGNGFTGRIGQMSSGVKARHKFEPSMGQSRQEELAFAHQIAILLNDAAARDAFEKLVVVATPQMLGFLRGEMTEKTRGRVAAEVNKEFANLPSPELQERLMGILRDPDIMSGQGRPH